MQPCLGSLISKLYHVSQPRNLGMWFPFLACQSAVWVWVSANSDSFLGHRLFKMRSTKALSSTMVSHTNVFLFVVPGFKKKHNSHDEGLSSFALAVLLLDLEEREFHIDLLVLLLRFPRRILGFLEPSNER